ncbi:hypothetical protein Tco_0415908 [Tanacetum coccineum]
MIMILKTDIMDPVMQCTTLPSHSESLKRFMFHFSWRSTRCYRLSHSEIVDIEKVAVRSSLRLPNNKCALIEVLRIILVVIARTFRVILFSIHNDEWKSFQSQHQTALRFSRRQQHLVHDESRFNTTCSLSVDKDKYMMKAQVHVSKSSAISDVQALPQKNIIDKITHVTAGEVTTASTKLLPLEEVTTASGS